MKSHFTALYSKITFRTRLFLGFCSIVALIIIVFMVSLNQFAKMQQASENLHEYQQISLTVADLRLAFLQVDQACSAIAMQRDARKYMDAEIANGNFKMALANLKDTSDISQAALAKLQAIDVGFDAYFKQAKQMSAAYLAGNIAEANSIKAEADQKSAWLDKQISNLKLSGPATKIEFNNPTKFQDHLTTILILVSVLVTVLGLGIAIYLSRYLNNQLGIDPFYAKGIAKELSKGDLTRTIKVDQGDTKSLLFALEKMRQQLLARRLQDQKTFKEILRVKFALDNVSVGMMITDDENRIVYFNHELKAIFEKAQNEICRSIPDFSIDILTGCNIQKLSFIPAYDEKLSAANSPQRIPLTLDGHHLVIIATPVFDGQGERLGTISEWHDHTEEVLVENELAAVVAAASMGEFNRNFNVQGKDGVMRLLGEGINQLMHTNKVSLNEISRVLSAVTQGDLTERITNSYFGTFGELKDSTNGTVDKLKGIISQIKDVTDIIHNGSKEIASGNNDLSQRTEKQALSLQHTTANIAKLTTAVQTNADNAKKGNQLAIRATEVAFKGGVVIRNVVNTMIGINDSSRKVVDIIAVIDNIAFQTNILALNAAVEAARAGDQGRGFAVVAGEVRNLAKLAAAAAGEIKHLIGDSVEKIEAGTQLVAEAGDTMDEILDSVQTVTGIMGSITLASDEQSIGIEQVNKAIAEMDGVTQQNAALVEEAAAAAESLEEQAQNLSNTVESFRVD